MSGSGITWWLGQHLLITTALTVIVFAICRAVRPNPAARHLLWLLVLCRLMFPSVATWPWPIAVTLTDSPDASHPLGKEKSAGDSTVIRREPAASSVQSPSDTSPVMVDAQSAVGNEAVRTPASAHTHPQNAVGRTDATSHTASWETLVGRTVFSLWAAGSLVVGILLVRQIRRVHRLLIHESEADTWLQDEIADWSNRLGVQAPRCVVSSTVRSPCVWCLGRVQLVWPMASLHADQREQTRPILLHELAHLKRGDHRTAWAELFALIVWWWNPVFWFVRWQLRASAEMACDAWVVSLLPNRRRIYAESLIEFSRRGPMWQPAFGTLGADSFSRRLFKRRLQMIMDENCATCFSKWTACAAVLLGLVSLPSFAIEPVAKQQQSSVPVESRTSDATVATETKTAAGAAQDTAQPGPSDIQQDRPPTTKTIKLEEARSRDAGTAQNEAAVGSSIGSPTSLDEVIARIEKQYYGHVDRRELERAAIQAIVGKLDDKSSVLSREEYEQMSVAVAGDLVGVGIAIQLDPKTQRPIVMQPIRNSPAVAAGLRRGDIILDVNGESTEKLSVNEVVGKIRGPRGSAVTLRFQRGDEKRDVKIVREKFDTLTVDPWSVSADGKENYWADRDDRIGYVHLPAFTQNTAAQLQKVLAGLSGEQMKSLVLDLRECSGGLLPAAVDVVSMFIDEGVILSSQARNESENVTIQAKQGGGYTRLPLVVLVNGQTASAAEIVAACLQDHHRAAVVGERTFGKGTVQSIFPLKDGGALRLTTAAWLRPNGKTLMRREGKDDWGVQPDAGLVVATTDEQRKQLAEHRQDRLNGQDAIAPSDDPQLQKAIGILKH
jgi:carboxyl-terminal processing protease